MVHRRWAWAASRQLVSPFHVLFVSREAMLNREVSVAWPPIVVEVILRAVLVTVAVVLEGVTPYHRVITQEEITMYNHPHIPDTIPFGLLVVLALGVPIAFFVFRFLSTGDKNDLIQATLGITLAVTLSWVVVDILKLSIGRPRPDFYFRCFPTEVLSGEDNVVQCTGKTSDIEQGLKSFPSGHTGCIFSCYGYLSLYLFDKLQCFGSASRGQSWRLCVSLLPLLVATLVGLSRIQSHKHHWEDVVVGAILGGSGALLCYYQFHSCVGLGLQSSASATELHSRSTLQSQNNLQI